MIEIRTFRSKRKLRVDLHRKHQQIDEVTGRVKYTYKQVGSFPFIDSKTYPNELNEVLLPEEVLQLKNWLAEAEFAEQFDHDADNLAKFTVRMPQTLYDAYSRLSQETKTQGIDFVPSKIMLESLLQKAKIVEHKYNKIAGKNSGILESVGVQTDKLMSDEEYQNLLDADTRIIFKALLNLKQPISRTCSELEEIADRYGKSRERIPPKQLQDWAGVLENRQLKKINRWCYAAAIDLLLKHRINPLEIAKPEKIAEYWAVQYHEKYSLNEAKRAFDILFNPKPQQKTLTDKAIEAVYKKI